MNIEKLYIFGSKVSLGYIGKPYLFRIPKYQGSDIDTSDTNISILHQYIGKQIFVANQCHSSQVLFVDETNKSIPMDGDAIITQLTNIAIFVLASDCVPIILYNENTETIGVIHAGRRGLEGGIIKNTLKLFPGNISQVQAYIGPCISKKNYELGHMEIKNFQDAYPDCIDISNPSNGKYFLDIGAVAYRQLTEYGVLGKNITVSGECTYENADIYHSYRRNTHCPEENYGNNAFGIWKS